MRVTTRQKQTPENRGVRVAAASDPASGNRGIGIKPTSIVGSNFTPWVKRQLASNENLLERLKQGKTKVNLRSKNNLSAFVNSARVKGGLELYKKFGGYYVIGHGFCFRNTGKFRIPKDKALLYVAKSGEQLGNTAMANIEQKLLRNNGRVTAFIQGSGKVTGLYYAGHNTRLFLPGEEVYDQMIHLTKYGPINNFNRNSNTNVKFNRPRSYGPSFGHIFKLPLRPGFSSQTPFDFNRNKNRILWNIPGMLSNRTVGLPNRERYDKRKETWKVSNIIKNGPPGVYVIGTCRQNVHNLSEISTNVLEATIRGMRTVQRGGNNYFKKVAQANIVDPSRGLLKTRNI
jgi:hypothetical protein